MCKDGKKHTFKVGLVSSNEGMYATQAEFLFFLFSVFQVQQVRQKRILKTFSQVSLESVELSLCVAFKKAHDIQAQ